MLYHLSWKKMIFLCVDQKSQIMKCDIEMTNCLKEKVSFSQEKVVQGKGRLQSSGYTDGLLRWPKCEHSQSWWKSKQECSILVLVTFVTEAVKQSMGWQNGHVQARSRDARFFWMANRMDLNISILKFGAASINWTTWDLEWLWCLHSSWEQWTRENTPKLLWSKDPILLPWSVADAEVLWMPSPTACLVNLQEFFPWYHMSSRNYPNHSV